MIWFFTSSIIIVLLIISYQDFKQRLIDWYYFPIAGILLISLVWTNNLNTLHNYLFNVGIILFLLFSATLYYSINLGKISIILDKSIGLADVLIFLTIGIIFSPLNFILFLLTCFLVGLIFKFVTSAKETNEIPLAGIIGVLFSIVLIYQTISGNIILGNDKYTLLLFYESLPVLEL